MANVSSSNGLEKRPRLAFRNTDGSHFPCWRQTSLGCIIEPYSEKVYGEHDYEVLTSAREGLQRQVDHFGSKQRHDTDGYNIIPFGYCTYRNRSDDGKFAFNINTISEKAIVSKFYPVFRFTNANSTFMAEFLNTSPRVKKKLSVLAVGTSQVVLSFEALKAAKFDLPCKDEQDKIAAFVECLNTRIENQRTLVAALKKYKRGVFEAVFSQKLRLVPTELQKPWKQYKLSDFATRVTRKNGNQTDIPLTISAQYGLIDQRDFFSKMVASTDMSGYYLLQKGEFAYNRSTSNEYPFGSIKRLELYPMGAVSTLYLCFAIKEEVVNSDLAKWYFESSQWYKGINNICAEGARNHGLLNVPTDGFFNTVHTLPSDPNEQLAVVDYLSNIQKKYEAAQRCLQAIENLRSGLLQQLFI